jgi:hypothetical protein
MSAIKDHRFLKTVMLSFFRKEIARLDLPRESAAQPVAERAPDSYRILRDHTEHHQKLVELFETRQTWAFNFALVLYAAAFAPLGNIVQLMGSPQASTTPFQVPVVAYTILIGYTVVLPALVLPVCFLYCDVSVFCAALNAGGLRYLRDAYRKASIPVPGNLDPGARAFEWLHMRDVDIDIDWIANWRVFLFFVAPLLGLLIAGIYLSEAWSDTHRLLKFGALIGLMISFAALVLTWRASRKTWDAREKARGEPFDYDIGR